MSSSSSEEEPLQKRRCTQAVNVRRTHEWSYRDKRTLIDAVKKHGLSDIKKITKIVGTKTQQEIESFVSKTTRSVDKKQNARERSLSRLFSKYVRAHQVPHVSYPPIALWKRVAQGIVRTQITETDYSIVLADIFSEMAKEEEKHAARSADFPDFGKCYTFIKDLLSNVTPAHLPPLESLSIMLALEEVMTLVRNKESFMDEIQFAHDYTGPTRFMQMKEDDSSENLSSGRGLKLLPLVVTSKVEDEDANCGEKPCSSNAALGARETRDVAVAEKNRRKPGSFAIIKFTASGERGEIAPGVLLENCVESVAAPATEGTATVHKNIIAEKVIADVDQDAVIVATNPEEKSGSVTAENNTAAVINKTATAGSDKRMAAAIDKIKTVANDKIKTVANDKIKTVANDKIITTASDKETTTASDKETTTASDKVTTTASDKVTTAVRDKVTAAASDKVTAAASDKVTTAASDKETTTASDKETTTASDKVTTSTSDKVTTSASDKVTTAASDKVTTSASDKMTTISSDGMRTSSVHVENITADAEPFASSEYATSSQTTSGENETEAFIAEEDETGVMSADSSGYESPDGSEKKLCVPAEVFQDILRHVKIKDHLNPLIAHIYMLHRDRELLKDHFDAIENAEKKVKNDLPPSTA